MDPLLVNQTVPVSGATCSATFKHEELDSLAVGRFGTNRKPQVNTAAHLVDRRMRMDLGGCQNTHSCTLVLSQGSYVNQNWLTSCQYRLGA